MRKKNSFGGIVMNVLDPGTKELTLDEETVEILEIIEECEDYSDLNDDYSPVYFEEY